MDFSNIFAMQEELDAHFAKGIKPSEHIETISEKRLLALYVEVAELANEIQSFKYWKKNIKFDKNKTLEEYADGIHFFSTFAMKYNINPIIKPKILNGQVTEQFLRVFEAINNMNIKMDVKTVTYAFELYLGIAKIMGYSDEEIETAYSNKNKINYERVNNNY